MVTVHDAISRATVRLPGGRLAQLVAVPGRATKSTGRHGAKAKVLLPSGAYLNVDPAVLEVVK